MSDLLAYDLTDAAKAVPFSTDYLRRAIHRTGDNPLPARLAGRKYVITREDLAAWVAEEGVQV